LLELTNYRSNLARVDGAATRVRKHDGAST